MAMIRRSDRKRTAAGAMVVIAGLLMLAGHAAAETEAERAEAKSLLNQGLKLLEKNDFAGARERFERAYKLVPSPKILFNLGEANLGLGRNAEAVRSFEGFLDQAPYAPQASRATAERKRDALRQKVGFIEPTSAEDGTSIAIDGQQVAQTPLSRPLAMEPGKHEITFEKPGMTPQTSTVSVLAGQSIPIVVRLWSAAVTPAAKATRPPSAPVAVQSAAPPPRATAPPPAAPVAAPAPAASLTSAPSSAPQETDASGARRMRLAALGTAGGALLALGAGVTFQLLSRSNNADFNAVRNAENSPIDGRCNERIVPDAGGARCDELRKAADRDQTIAVVGFVAGGILAAGSAVLYLMASSDGKPDRVQALTCRPDVTRAGVGAGCTLSF
ncbi:MAG TPA: tetratricopeptide repeat protein [Polyangia bacterium]|nr:tetratricopeptide repeat protein [Polyangia bacterium]